MNKWCLCYTSTYGSFWSELLTPMERLNMEYHFHLLDEWCSSLQYIIETAKVHKAVLDNDIPVYSRALCVFVFCPITQ